ncbi:MAG: hypothetical protein ACRDPO_15615 [Streptosporangiaceae bacterium]
MKRKILGGILATGLLAGLLPALAATQAVGSIVPGGGGQLKMCQAGQRIHVDGPWGHYLLKNNDLYPHAAAICITHYRSGPDFAVTASRARTYGSESEAYPNIFAGCSYDNCAHNSSLPARVFRMKHPWVSYFAKLQPKGKWDANIDMWLSRREQKTGIVTGAEVMIWPDAHGFGRPAGNVRVDGRRWHLVHWRTRSLTDPKITWPLIIFRAVPGRGDLRHLPLLPFFRVLKHLHLIHQGYWLDSLHAGFEIWAGGKGMKLQWFRLGGVR